MRLIKNCQVIEDGFTLILADENGTLHVPTSGDLIVPHSWWKENRDTALARIAQGDKLGIWVPGHAEPEEALIDSDKVALIAIHIPHYRDGRAYSLARLLRIRHHYSGELRAVGEVLQDQLFYYARVGFDAFAIRADRDAQAALAALTTFSERYQGSCDQPSPLFRRRTLNQKAA